MLIVVYCQIKLPGILNYAIYSTNYFNNYTTIYTTR